MKDFFTGILIWIRSNLIIAVFIAIALIMAFGTKQVSRLFSTRRRSVKHGAKWYKDRGKPLPQRLKTRSGRTLPRSAGRRRPAKRTTRPAVRSGRRGYPKAGGGTIPFKRNKDGTIKKAAFVAGTVAAKRRMAQLRKYR